MISQHVVEVSTDHIGLTAVETVHCVLPVVTYFTNIRCVTLHRSQLHCFALLTDYIWNL